MKRSYLAPTIKDHDFSKFQFAKNQATCGPEILGSVELQESNDFPFGAACGAGLFNDTRVQICLTGSIDANLLEGLTVVTLNGQSSAMNNCSPGDPFDQCDGFSYVCDVNIVYNTGPGRCVTRLECPDGTLIDTCGNNSACLLSPS